MHFPNKIFLIGLPGSGKSTVGQKLADELGRPFFDLDEIISTAQGQSISQIFQDKGESQFRQLETLALNETIGDHSTFVLATGGGTPCFNNNMEKMLAAGRVIFLDVPVAGILNRLTTQQIAIRPMFIGKNPEKVLGELREQRLQYYEQADIIVEGDKITADYIIEQLRID